MDDILDDELPEIAPRHQVMLDSGKPLRFLMRRFGGSADPAAPDGWKMKAPIYGSNSSILLARREQGEPKRAAVRQFTLWRHWRNYNRCVNLLAQANLNTPRLLTVSQPWERWFYNEPWFTVEAFLDGTPLIEIEYTPEVIEALGRAIGKMHAVTSPKFHWKRKMRDRDQYAKYYIGVLERRRDNMKRILGPGGTMPDPELFAQIDPLMLKTMDKLRTWIPRGQFVLVHNGLGADDMLWDDKRREVIFLDVGTLRFNLRQFDLRSTLRRLQGKEAETGKNIIAPFFEAYWREIKPEDRKLSEEDEPMLACLTDGIKLVSRLRLMKLHPERRAELMPVLMNVVAGIKERLAAK